VLVKRALITFLENALDEEGLDEVLSHTGPAVEAEHKGFFRVAFEVAADGGDHQILHQRLPEQLLVKERLEFV